MYVDRLAIRGMQGACRDHRVFVNKESGMCDASYSPTRKVTIVEILCLSFDDS